MKYMLLLLAGVAFIAALDAQQIFGELSANSVVIHAENIRWISSTPDREVRRYFRFPFSSQDERRSPIIGAVVVHHNSRNGRAELRWGGPGQRYVGVEVISGRGENLNTWVQVYTP